MPRWKLTIHETIDAPTREDAIRAFDDDEGFDTEYTIEEMPDPWVTSTPTPISPEAPGFEEQFEER